MVFLWYFLRKKYDLPNGQQDLSITQTPITSIKSSSPQLISNRLRTRLRVMEVGNLKFSWKIKNFSKIQDKIIYSDVFPLGPYKWKIGAHPKGLKDSHLSIFLEVADSETLPSGWSLKTKFLFTLVDQIDSKSSITDSDDKKYEYKAGVTNWGCHSFISHENLHDPNKGYLVEDTCIINVDVTVYGDEYLESHVSSKETNSEEISIEEMTSFFGSLQSVISTNRVVSSEEEAKEALAVIEDTLNKVPSDVNNSGGISQLRNAFEVLSLSDGSSILTSEQKVELLSMKDKLIDLPERAANVVNDKNLFTEKELVKKTLDHKLRRCLIEFEKTKAESIKNDEKLDSLFAQIEETKKLRENFSSRMKEMFKLSKELKAELDVLLENWPEYEAKMKAAEEEEKIVSTEWSKMKQLFSSMKKPIYPSSSTLFGRVWYKVLVFLRIAIPRNRE